MKTITEALKQAMTSKHWTTYNLAKASGVSHPQIVRFLNGTRGISLETADKLATAVGLSITFPRPTRKRSGPSES